MQKRALAYIGGPRQLQDFVWYYLAYGKEYKWDLVCQPLQKEMKLEDVCRNSGLFEKIYMPAPFLNRSKIRLVGVAFKMFCMWIFGKNKIYARHELLKDFDLSLYSHICLSTVRGVTCGMMALAADDGTTISLLEDGQGDNTNPKTRFELKRIKEDFYIPSYLLAKMGYCNPWGRFPLKSTKRCDRYSLNPDGLAKELYKSVNLLNDFSLIDVREYNSLLDKIFGNISGIDGAEAVLFTSNMRDFTGDAGTCVKKVCEYLSVKGYKKIIIKKHPRDLENYVIENVETINIDSIIPGEILAKEIKEQDLYFMYPSTTLGAFEDGSNKIVIFRFDNLDNMEFYKSNFNRGCKIVSEETHVEFEIIDI